MIEKTCPGCGGVIRPVDESLTALGVFKKKKFCSHSCSTRHYARQREYSGSGNPNWRGGKTAHPLYEVWSDAKARCHRPSHPRFMDYGGRGIEMAEEWREDFWAFVEGVGERPEGVSAAGRSLWSLDRIDNNRGYEPGNVRWASAVQQAKNSRHKRSREQRGSANASSKLTEKQVLEIRESLLPAAEVAMQYGTSAANIHMIRSRKTWTHI